MQNRHSEIPPCAACLNAVKTSMNEISFPKAKLACAWFFVAPALVYGIFTSRLPALKLLLGMDDSQTAILLFALGASTLCGLLGCGLLIDRLGIKNILIVSTLCLGFFIILACAGCNFWAMLIFCALAGVCVGFCDVATNAAGIALEKRFDAGCLSFLHAFSGIGGVAGSLSGSFCASMAISPFFNMLLVLAIFFILMPLAWRGLGDYGAACHPAGKKPSWRHLSFYIYFFGFMSLVCHLCEGSTAEWGAILLHSAKGATQREAALAFAAFTAAMVLCRLFVDRLRIYISDSKITFLGCLLGALGIAITLVSPWPLLCLCGYAVMGMGLAPVSPILFSRAGAEKGATPGQASAIISIFSYSGLLLFPPFLGMLGAAWGLVNSLWLVFGLCCALALGSVAMRR